MSRRRKIRDDLIAAGSAKQPHSTKRTRSTIPAGVDRAGSKSRGSTNRRQTEGKITMIDRQEIIERLAEMSPDERREVVAEASGQATDPKAQAAAALRTYLHGGRD